MKKSKQLNTKGRLQLKGCTNAACETDAKLLFCPECFLHMQALEQVPPQPRDLHVPMVLTTAIGHPFSWSRQ